MFVRIVYNISPIIYTHTYLCRKQKPAYIYSRQFNFVVFLCSMWHTNDNRYKSVFLRKKIIPSLEC